MDKFTRKKYNLQKRILSEQDIAKYEDLNKIVDVVNNILQTIPSYSSYICNLTQSGTDNPVANVLTNTVDDSLIWYRSGEGSYKLTATNAWVGNVWINGMGDYTGANPFIPIWNGIAADITGYYTMYKSSDNDIYLDVFDSSFTNTDISDLLGVTTLYIPEIRLY